MTTGYPTLNLLGYPLGADLLGRVWIYELGDKVAQAWDELHEDVYGETGSRGNLPYAGLATALRAVGRTSLNFDPTSKRNPPKRMIVRTPLAAEDLHAAATVWNQVLLRRPDDEIRLSFASRLADAMAKVKPAQVALADHIRRVGSQPDADSWVYAAATWEIAQRIANPENPDNPDEPPTLWKIDGETITFRADTDGNLIVWDPDLLWAGQWKPKKGGQTQPPSYATLRVDLAMKTMPWIKDPVVVLNPTASRFTRWPNFAGSAWLEQAEPTAPLLALGLEKGHLESTSRIALKVYAQLRGIPSIIPGDYDLGAPDSPLRALVPKSVRFPVGRGVGMHLLRGLSEHFTTTLEVEPLKARTVQYSQFSEADRLSTEYGRDAELLHSDTLPGIITASGCDRLRIHVLYQQQHTRARLQRILAHHFARPELAEEGIPEGVVFAITDRVDIVIQNANDLLEHGPHDNRRELLGKLKHLNAPAGVRAVALCETEYDAAEWATQRKQARRKDSGICDPDDTDAKPVVNWLLADIGIAAQFVATKPPSAATEPAAGTTEDDDEERDGLFKIVPSDDPENVDPIAVLWNDDAADDDPLVVLGKQIAGDHAGNNAFADMLRTAGLVHPRIGNALARGRLGIVERTAYVGLHVREQQGEFKKSGEPLLSWGIVALIPVGDNWQVKAYATAAHPRGGRQGWTDYTSANNAYRANELREGRRGDKTFADTVETALSQLDPHLNGMGYVLFVSGESTRSVWPRLANRHLENEPDSNRLIVGRRPLPGFSLKGPLQPRAVVRVTSGTDYIPRPVQGNRKDGTTVKTNRNFYELDGSKDTWILSNVPRQFEGGSKHSRAGEKHTRWTSEGVEQTKTWYAHTATEIFVAAHDGDSVRYALAAARLCHHALYWEGRTSFPAPLHMAIQMDKNHPQYRRTVDLDNEVDPEDSDEL